MSEVSPPPGEVIIGIDIGTTAAKVTAFGVGDRWRRHASAEYPLMHPHPGWEVQDPELIVDTVVQCLADVASACVGTTVLAVSLSSAMHGLMALDEDRRPLTPLVTWADSRAASIANELRESSGVDLHRRSGTPVHPMSPVTKLIWFAHNDPDTWRRARYWVGLKDWALLRLTGRMITELSCASGTGLLDLATRSYSSQTLGLIGLDEDRLPEILHTTDRIPISDEMARQVGLPTGTPVVPGAGDGPCGNLGTGALGEGVGGLSIGTSGALRMVVPTPRVDPSGRLFCYCLTDDAWVIGGAVSNGGSAVRWSGTVFGTQTPSGGPPSEEELLALAEAVPPGSEGLIALPYLMAERAPLWDPRLPGAFLGMRRAHTAGHFVRAVVEGVARQLGTVLADLDEQQPIRQIRATGGVFQSTLWRAVLADSLNRELVVTDDAEGSGLGAAVLGLVGVGRVSSLDEGLGVLSPPQREEELIEPDAERARIYRVATESIGGLVDQLSVSARALAPPALDDQA